MGFEINTQGPKAAGMGGAVAGYALDGSAVFYNPAAVSFLNKNYFNVGCSAILPKTAFLGETGKEEMLSDKMYFPYSFYGSYKIKELTSIGLSINNPFGIGAEWEDNWSGRYVVQKSNFSVMNIQPTLSYKINELWSFGIGPVVMLGKFKLDKVIAVETAAGETELELEGKGTSYGVNAGVYRQEGKISAGITFRSGATIKIKDGTADFINVPSSFVLENTYPNSTSFSTQFCTPTIISAGLAYQIKEPILLTLDYSFYSWKSFEKFEVNYSSYQNLDFTIKNNFQNSFSINAGVQYDKNEKLTLRGGLGYDQSPMQDGYLSPLMPDANKFYFFLRTFI